MKQKSIDFRELLERLLPLEELLPAERMRVQRALQAGVSSRLEQAALLALSQLEQRGVVRRVPAPNNGSHAVIRYQSRDALDVITLHLPSPLERDGLLLYSRSSLPLQAKASLDQVRRLLRFDDPLLFTEPGQGDPRNELIEQLDQVGREFLGASAVRLIRAERLEGESLETPLDAALADEMRAHPEALYYCPDTTRCPRLEAAGRRLGMSAVAIACVTDSEDRPLGHLEVLSVERNPFLIEDLSMIALLADYCSGMLERSARIQKLVFIDPLTSAYNRAYFDLQLRNEMARAGREQSSMALCIADIDDFKSINTAYGYEAGNRVLVEVADLLKRGVRPFDTVARWGGEEFAVLLTAPILADDVLTISERLRTLVERLRVRVEGLDRRPHDLGVTVSIGVALAPDHAEDTAGLWRAANQALLLAKHPPKNQVVFFQPDRDARSGAG